MTNKVCSKHKVLTKIDFNLERFCAKNVNLQNKNLKLNLELNLEGKNKKLNKNIYN